MLYTAPQQNPFFPTHTINMKQVASLQYGVIFRNAFSQIDKVETEKSFTQKIGNIKVEFDLYAEDLKNRIVNEH